MAGRKPVPDAIKDLTGSKRPRNGNAPKYAYVDAASARVPKDVQRDPYALEEWNFVIQELINNRMLTRANLRCFANYCLNVAYALHADDDVHEHGRLLNVPIMNKKGDVVDYKKISNPAISQVNIFRLAALRYAVEFGLTPSSQTRVFALPGADDDGKGATGDFTQFTGADDDDGDGSYPN
jgi:P27 family predicted phage terminase small subunit